jgi:prepilin-type N-terminal cleavage/methylation domain-containing protein
MHRNSGFTLIELIMVIVLLGILSAFALPRFADLSSNAETAVVNGFLGALQSSRAIHYSSWQVNGRSSALVDYTALTNTIGVLTGNAVDGIAHELDCDLIWADLLEDPPALAFVSGVNGYLSSFTGDQWGRSAQQIAVLGEASDVYCHYVYVTNKAAAPTIRYNISTGEIDVVSWPYSP